MSFASPNCSAYDTHVSPRAVDNAFHTHGLENARSTFGVPSLNVAAELLAGVEDAVVVVLVMERPSDRVSEHPLRQWRQGVDRIRLQESRSV